MPSMRMHKSQWLRGFARRRRVVRFGRLRALARATRALYASSESFAPYRTVNAIQRTVSRDLPAALNPFVPANLRAAAGKRAAQVVLASAQSQLVREAIVIWHSLRHRAVLPVPLAAYKSWPGGSAAVDKMRSGLAFVLFLTACWLAALRRFAQLARHMRAVSPLPPAPYIVAMNVSADVVNCAAKGGFLNWLHAGPALELGSGEIVAVTGRQTNAAPPEWLHLADQALPPLGRVSFWFLLGGACLIAMTPLLALFGVWQSLALLPDLIELSYVRRVNEGKLARAYLFLLGDQACRPLWTFDAASRGARVALVFYASSYQLFDYGNPVPADIRHPSLLLNIWDECWFQTGNALADIGPLLPAGVDCKVVGTFDMVDSGEALPHLPVRTVAVFDVEPTAQALRWSQAGYILPTLTEEVIVEFWSKLAGAARALDFVIIHKPKRFGLLQQEWRYRKLLASLEAEGRYISLPPEFGPMRLMRHAEASVILPFTSVGDLALGAGSRAFYFDVYGTIPEPEKYSGGIPVVVGAAAMTAKLRDYLGSPQAPLRASIG